MVDIYYTIFYCILLFLRFYETLITKRRNLWNDLFGNFEDFDVKIVKFSIYRNVLGKLGVMHLHGV
jgi:hypothetical protein